MSERESELPNETKIAAFIRECNIANQYVTLTKIVEHFSPAIGRNEISHHLDTLMDFGWVQGEYGETEPRRAGYCYFIDEDHEALVDEVIEKFL